MSRSLRRLQNRKLLHLLLCGCHICATSPVASSLFAAAAKLLLLLYRHIHTYIVFILFMLFAFFIHTRTHIHTYICYSIFILFYLLCFILFAFAFFYFKNCFNSSNFISPVSFMESRRIYIITLTHSCIVCITFITYIQCDCGCT